MGNREHSSGAIQTLLERAAQGDESAYDQLITAAADRVRRLSRRMLKNYPALRRWEETDDVFQNAVMRLRRSLSEVRPETVSNFYGLAATQIRRTLIDLVRHHFGPHGHAAHHDSNRGDANNVSAGPLNRAQGATSEPTTLDAWARFHEAVQQLPEDERSVFELIWYGGMEQSDVAGLANVSLSTVQRRWYRARHLIQQQMSGEWSAG